jgi:poly(3-hydroxybutyrate) depolymerase
VRTWTIHFRAHDGRRNVAYVVLPAWYGPKRNPPLPLIISPHGRGLTGRANALLWGGLPARGAFAVVNPDSRGRRLPSYSWGYRGQIEDLARMPEIVRLTLPWVRIDTRRIYAFGGSMGGQETLLLLARHPRLLAGAAAFDSVVDFTMQYRRFRLLACRGACRLAWKKSEAFGQELQKRARLEIGGSPKTTPARYAARSPITYARRIARSCVPLQLWWSVADRVVSDQRQQSARLFWELRRLNPEAPVSAFAGFWIHSAEMRAKSLLPIALAQFGLLPGQLGEPVLPVRIVPAPRTYGCLPDTQR